MELSILDNKIIYDCTIGWGQEKPLCYAGLLISKHDSNTVQSYYWSGWTGIKGYQSGIIKLCAYQVCNAVRLGWAGKLNLDAKMPDKDIWDERCFQFTFRSYMWIPKEFR